MSVGRGAGVECGGAAAATATATVTSCSVSSVGGAGWAGGSSVAGVHGLGLELNGWILGQIPEYGEGWCGSLSWF